MKKHLIIIVSLLLAFISCDKMPADNRFDGMWQLMSVEHGNNQVDMKSARVYWSFRRNLVQYNYGNGERLYSHVVYMDDSLMFTDFFHNTVAAVDGDDNLPLCPDEADVLGRGGVFAPYEGTSFVSKYCVEAVSSSKMILRNSRSLLVFRKL